MIFAKFFALAGLAVLSVDGAAPSAIRKHRKVQDVTDLCITCDLCETLSDLCDLGAISDISDFACDLCTSLGDDGDIGSDTDDLVCFSEVATVQVLQKDMSEFAVPMKELQVGDKILTGMNQYETVYAFGHHNPTKFAKFYQIHNDNNNRPLEMTADHMLFLEGQKTPVSAASVRVGDVLHSAMGASKVTKVSSVERKGIYAPLTTGGKLLVDGVMASSYISLGNDNSVISDHNLIHMTLSSYRMVCSGISASFCDTNTYGEDGMPHFVQYGLRFLHWIKSCNVMVQAIASAALVVPAGFTFAWEMLFGASMGPLMAFVAAVAYTTYRKNNKSKAKLF